MQSGVPVLVGPFIPMDEANSSDEPDMVPVIPKAGPIPTSSGLFDIRTLVSDQTASSPVHSSAEPDLLDDMQMPCFGGISLVEMSVVPSQAKVKAEAALPVSQGPSRTLLMLMVFTLASIFVGMLFAL